MTGPARPVLDSRRVRAARLEETGLRQPVAPDLASVVGRLLAVQGQELQPALWGTSRRVDPATRPGRTAANRALADGEVLRTHVLRPTWHLVRPADVRWLLELTAPRVARRMASTERSWGLDDPGPGVEAIAAEVAAGPCTRAELKSALLARKVLHADAPGIAFTQMLMHAELRQVVVSGPPPADRPDQHQVYAAFDDRVPAGYGPLGETFDAEAAVLELWRRYLPGRAFATPGDLRSWSDVPLADLRRGTAVLRDAGEVVEVPGAGDLEGLTLVTTPPVAERRPAPDVDGPELDLLQAYDELLVSYRETRHVVLDPALPPPDRQGAFVHSVAVDGVVAGRWRWPANPPRNGPADVEVQWMRDVTAAERAALSRRVADLDAYLGRRAGEAPAA